MSGDFDVIYDANLRKKQFKVVPQLALVTSLLQTKLNAYKENNRNVNITLFHTIAYNMVKNLSNTPEYMKYERLKKHAFYSLSMKSTREMVANLVSFTVSEVAALKRNAKELVSLSEADPYALVQDYFEEFLKKCKRDVETELPKVMAYLRFHGPVIGRKGKKTRIPDEAYFSEYFVEPGRTVEAALIAVEKNPKKYTIDSSLV